MSFLQSRRKLIASWNTAGWVSNPKPSYCNATVLTTAPLSSPPSTTKLLVGQSVGQLINSPLFKSVLLLQKSFPVTIQWYNPVRGYCNWDEDVLNNLYLSDTNRILMDYAEHHVHLWMCHREGKQYSDEALI